MADRLRAQGYTADKAHQQAMEILNFSLRVVTEVRGNDSVVSQQQASISARALAAFLQGDSATYTTTLAQLAALASSRLSAAQMTQIHSDEDKLMNELPLPLGDWQALIASLCWDRSKLDPCQLVSDYKRFGEQYHKYKKK
jgi:hypothetical protein